MSAYRLKILTPEKKTFDSEVNSMTVTCEDGQLTVLAGHAPLLAMLAEGPIVIRTGQEIIEGEAGRGILKVDRKETAVLVHSFRQAGDETEEEAEEAVVNDLLL